MVYWLHIFADGKTVKTVTKVVKKVVKKKPVKKTEEKKEKEVEPGSSEWMGIIKEQYSSTETYFRCL